MLFFMLFLCYSLCYKNNLCDYFYFELLKEQELNFMREVDFSWISSWQSRLPTHSSHCNLDLSLKLISTV